MIDGSGRIGSPGQPAELAGIYVLLASPEFSDAPARCTARSADAVDHRSGVADRRQVVIDVGRLSWQRRDRTPSPATRVKPVCLLVNTLMLCFRTIAVLCSVAALSSLACSRHDRRLEQHQKVLQSLASTAHAVADAWLAGYVSGTYTETALEQTFLLIEQERTTLARTPDTIIDPRGARLSDAADQMARVTAQIISDVRAADGVAARRHLASLPNDEREAR
jgi:hypothetical protein